MPSDPSFGTTGFFSYLWTPRRAVFSNFDRTPKLTSDDGLWRLTDDDADGHFDYDRRLTGGAFDSNYFLLIDDNAPSGTTVYRWI